MFGLHQADSGGEEGGGAAHDGDNDMAVGAW